MKLTTAQWATVLKRCAVSAAVIALWAPILAEQINDNTFSKGDAEVPDFMANILHESGRLAMLEEKLKYSAARIAELAKLNGPASRWARAHSLVLSGGMQPYDDQTLAEVLYGNRFGNTYPGDGWTYRGRGPIGLTFKGNYALVGDLVGQDLVNVPDLAAQPRFALDIAVAWWEDKVPDSAIGNVDLVRRVVNGGKIGLDDVRQLTNTFKAALQEVM